MDDSFAVQAGTEVYAPGVSFLTEISGHKKDEPPTKVSHNSDILLLDNEQ